MYLYREVPSICALKMEMVKRLCERDGENNVPDNLTQVTFPVEKDGCRNKRKRNGQFIVTFS